MNKRGKQSITNPNPFIAYSCYSMKAKNEESFYLVIFHKIMSEIGGWGGRPQLTKSIYFAE